MEKPKFRLEVSYSEKTGEPVAAYLRIREGNVAATKEVSTGIAFADYAADGVLLGSSFWPHARSSSSTACQKRTRIRPKFSALRRSQENDRRLMA